MENESRTSTEQLKRRHTSNVDLDLAGNDKTIIGLRPLSVQILELLHWRIKKGSFGKSLLHRTLDKTVYHEILSPLRDVWHTGSEAQGRMVASMAVTAPQLGPYLKTTL